MSRLSKQSIRKLCEPLPGVDALPHTPMISPFEPNKVRVEGVSKGLSHASYDASIAHDLVLGRHPGYVIKEWVLEKFSPLIGHKGKRVAYRWYQWPGAVVRVVRATNQLLWDLGDLAQRLRDEPPAYSLAYTIEDFCMPANVGGDVADKSTFARVFVSAFNTFFDPGFHGNATLELVNQSDTRVEYKAGQGVCQFIFTWLDEATEAPYDGKYQHQTQAAHGPRYEASTQAPVRDHAAARARHDAETLSGQVGHNLSWSGQKGEFATIPLDQLEGCTIRHTRAPTIGENLTRHGIGGDVGIVNERMGYTS